MVSKLLPSVSGVCLFCLLQTLQSCSLHIKTKIMVPNLLIVCFFWQILVASCIFSTLQKGSSALHRMFTSSSNIPLDFLSSRSTHDWPFCNTVQQVTLVLAVSNPLHPRWAWLWIETPINISTAYIQWQLPQVFQKLQTIPGCEPLLIAPVYYSQVPQEHTSSKPSCLALDGWRVGWITWLNYELRNHTQASLRTCKVQFEIWAVFQRCNQNKITGETKNCVYLFYFIIFIIYNYHKLS